MRTKNFCRLLNCLLLCTFFLSACSSDDDKNENKGNFRINGESYTADGGGCSNGIVNNEDGIYVKAGFEVALNKANDYLNGYSFYFQLGSYNFKGIKVNDNLSDIISIKEFRKLNILYGDQSFDKDVTGQIIVKSISDKNITLEFVGFTFKELLKGSSSRTFVLDGTINYKINPK